MRSASNLNNRQSWPSMFRILQLTGITSSRFHFSKGGALSARRWRTLESFSIPHVTSSFALSYADSRLTAPLVAEAGRGIKSVSGCSPHIPLLLRPSVRQPRQFHRRFLSWLCEGAIAIGEPEI